jgi:hypothetical protein
MKPSLRSVVLLSVAAISLLAVSGSSGFTKKGIAGKADFRSYGGIEQPAQPGDSTAGVGTTGREHCLTTGEFGSTPIDKDISCDSPIAPDNELAIAAHPTNPDLLLAGSNDYHLSQQNFFPTRIPAGVFLSQDGGLHWIDSSMPMKASLGAGDPAPAFDLKHNQAVMASLSFVCGQGAPVCSRGNLAVATLDLSKLTPDPTDDEQLQWQDQMVVNGEASDVGAVQIFNDKEWIAVDNYATIPNPRAGQPGQPAMIANPNFGNIYLVWARFRSEKGAYDESPIWFTKSENGGGRWSEPVEISGRSLTKCTFQDDPDDSADTTGDDNPSAISETADDPNACDQDQFAIPVVAPDGTLYVHFHNEQNSAAYEHPQRYDSQVMIVKSDDGGDTWYGDPDPAEQAGCRVFPYSANADTDFDNDGRPDQGAGPCIVPIHIVDMEDSYDSSSQSDDGSDTSIADYPINVQGRTTLTAMQFRVNSAGNITVARGPSPAAPYRLYITYADNCAGVRPGFAPTPSEDPSVPPVPVPTAVTDTNLYYAYSDDEGRTWVGGDGPENGLPYNTCSVSGGVGAEQRLIMRPGVDNFVGGALSSVPDDQWFPWIDANTYGQTQTTRVVAGTMDANQFDGPVRETYGFTGWENTTPPTVGVPNFEGPVPLAGAASHPRQSRFFRTAAVDPTHPCPDCSRFIGDYNGLAIGADGVSYHSVWTDMRRPVPPAVERPVGCDDDPTTEEAPPCVEVFLRTSDAYYARRPTHPFAPPAANPFPETEPTP